MAKAVFFAGDVGGEKKNFAMGSYRFKADGSALEFLHQFSNNTWGQGANAAGDAFGGTANNAPIFFGVMYWVADPLTSSPMGRFLVLLLVVRGLPALVVYRGVLSARHRGALGILQSTALPLLVVITEIGVSTGQMQAVTAVALVGAGMCSVLVFPLVGFAVLDRAGPVDP